MSNDAVDVELMACDADFDNSYDSISDGRIEAEDREQNDDFYLQRVRDIVLEKGTLSCLISVAIFVVGFALSGLSENGSVAHVLAAYIISFGLFGFSGGFTNWVAIKMLFNRVPLLIGSGVIPARYIEIREQVKMVIMSTFFSEEFLDKYASQKLATLAEEFDMNSKIDGILGSSMIDEMIDVKLASLASIPEGQIVISMGIDPNSLKPMIKPFVLSVGAEVAPILFDKLSPQKHISIDVIVREVDIYISMKLRDLSEDIVTNFIRVIIEDHLGWLVVWGVVFGSIIGVISQAASLAPNY